MPFPPIISKPAPARKRIYGCQEPPVETTGPSGQKPSPTSSKNAWLAPRLARTASRPQKPCACTPSSSTVPKSATGRSKTVTPIRPRPNARTPRCAAGSAPRSANSGNWTLHPIAGSLPVRWTFPCLICLTIAAACSSAPNSTTGNSCSPTWISSPPPS